MAVTKLSKSSKSPKSNGSTYFVTWPKLLTISIGMTSILVGAVFLLVTNTVDAHASLPYHRGGVSRMLFDLRLTNVNNSFIRLEKLIKQNQTSLRDIRELVIKLTSK